MNNKINFRGTQIPKDIGIGLNRAHKAFYILTKREVPGSERIKTRTRTNLSDQISKFNFKTFVSRNEVVKILNDFRRIFGLEFAEKTYKNILHNRVNMNYSFHKVKCSEGNITPIIAKVNYDNFGEFGVVVTTSGVCELRLTGKIAKEIDMDLLPYKKICVSANINKTKKSVSFLYSIILSPYAAAVIAPAVTEVNHVYGQRLNAYAGDKADLPLRIDPEGKEYKFQNQIINATELRG